MNYSVLGHDPSASVIVANYENLELMLIKSCILVENSNIRDEMMKFLQKIIIPKSETPEMKEMLKIIKILAVEIKNVADLNQTRVKEYFIHFN